ncbi:MAG: D-glycero-beta-D-manno-heptose-7-phosphate kinase [Firmicutes bacterium]|nr:D-glycero-beta-D-manno-heptose-7-phosphate kinase [Bacillota bacterium]
MKMPHLRNLINEFSKRKILVIGDLIWDWYVRGKAERISPEAPVPVVRVLSEKGIPGGAANVARNLRALGARVWLVGTTGRDGAGIRLIEAMEEEGIETSGVISLEHKPTTVKARIVAQGQQVVRVDKENPAEIDQTTALDMVDYIKGILSEVEVIAISDYAKGVVTPFLTQAMLNWAGKYHLPVLVDPKGKNYSNYAGVSVITPNEKEAEQATGITFHEEKDVEQAGLKLLELAKDNGAVFITRGEQGISIIEKKEGVFHLPAMASEVFDVTGAGDTVLSVLALAVASGLTYCEAGVLCNLAAGQVVQKLGTAVVTSEELWQAALSFPQAFQFIRRGKLKIG